MRSDLIIEQADNAPAAIDFLVCGSVQDVIAGNAPGEGDWLDVSGTLAGYEAGSPLGRNSIGEMISFNGHVYARSTEAGSPLKGKLLHGSSLITNGAAFLPAGAKPFLTIEVTEPIDLQTLYQNVFARTDKPFCIVGTGRFSSARVTSITRPPIHGEALFDHRDTYYADGEWTLTDTPMAIVGCGAVLSEVNSPDAQEALAAVLYQNPGEPAQDLTVHTHALELARDVDRAADVSPADAVMVHHLFHDATLSGGRFEVYLVDGARGLPAGEPPAER